MSNYKMATVGIIGLGYVGLPTAIGFHDAGFEVWGVDVSQRTVDMVLAGNPGLQGQEAAVKAAVEKIAATKTEENMTEEQAVKMNQVIAKLQG